MYNYIKGHVALIEHHPSTGAITVTVVAAGLGLGIKVYRLPPGLLVGAAIEFYLVQAYSQAEGYRFYGFYDPQSWALATKLCNEVRGIGPAGVTALVHGVDYSTLRRIGMGVGPKLLIKGIGGKKEAELRRGLMVVFEGTKTDDTLGDNLEVALEQARVVLANFGVTVSDKVFMEMAMALPAEEVSASKLVERYLARVRSGRTE